MEKVMMDDDILVRGFYSYTLPLSLAVSRSPWAVTTGGMGVFVREDRYKGVKSLQY